MIKHKVTKDIFKIAFPVAIQMMIEYIFTFAGTVFIGRYNVEGLSAVNNALTVYFMSLSFFVALTQGTTILITQNLGAEKKELANGYAKQSFMYNQVIFSLYFLLWYFLGGKILYLVGARGDVLEMATTYIKTLAFLNLWKGIFLAAYSIFQGIGDTKPIMFSSIIKTGLSVFLGWALVFGKLGLPEFGVQGAALATVISDAIGDSYLIWKVFRNKVLAMKVADIFTKPKLFIYKNVVKIGFPSGFDSMFWTVGQVIIIYMLNKDNPLVAGYFGLFNTIMNLSTNMYMGLGVASLTLVGKETGAKDHLRASKIAKTAILYSFCVCLGLSLINVLFPKNVLSFFMKEQNLVNQLYIYMYLTPLIMFPRAVNVVVGSAIKGRGDTKWMMYTQVLGTVLSIPILYVCLFHFKLGLKGVLITVFIDEFWRALINYGKFTFTKTIYLPDAVEM